MNPVAGWPSAELIETARLILEPLRVAHAEEMAKLLADTSLYKFLGEQPATEDQLRSRYTRLVSGQSPDGQRGWLNWIVRDRERNDAVGTVQAETRRTGAMMSAELAWVIGARYQRKGYAREAASGLMTWLRQREFRVFIAHAHPDHTASMAVARYLGLEPTDVIFEGETRWARDER